MPRKLENWLAAYQEFTSGTESPPTFHFWVGIGTIAGAAQRKIKMDAGYFEIHSNLYIVLVSPAGKSRKTTALRIGKGLLSAAKDYGQDINFSTQSATPAALVRQFVSITNSEHQSLTTFSAELGSLLGSRSAEVTDFLTDIYDANPDWDKQTVSRGLEKIGKPWFNLLAATTPQWMGDNLSKTAMEGGFVSRTIFIYQDTRLRVAFHELTDREKQLKRDLAHDLAQIASLKGNFQFAPDAKQFYADWYEDPKRSSEQEDYRISGFSERKHIHVLKVAMALSLAQKDELILTVPDIKAAIMVLDDAEKGIHKAFQSVGRNIHATAIERIRTQIEKEAQGMTYKKLINLNAHDVDKRDLDRILVMLVEMGQVRWAGGTLHSMNGNGAKPPP